MPFENFPNEMKIRRQWAISGENKAPCTTDGKIIFNISVTDPRYFLTFQEAEYYANLWSYNIGYILMADDPFTCIDIDTTDADSQARKGQPIDPTKWTSVEDKNRYWQIIQTFKSYTEFSKNGRGFHIWVKGNIGKGHRKDGVEVYSQERYIICTGNVLNDLPIVDCQHILDNMVSQMKPQARLTGLEELPAEHEDVDIINMALNASNKDKFNQLCNGDWSGYPSQSEADLALLSMFTFYSQSNAQCRRLFRMTGLGQRDKAIRDDKYLNNTLRLIRTREQSVNEVNFSQIEIASELVQQLQYQKVQTEFLHTMDNTDDNQYVKPMSTAFAERFSDEIPKSTQGIDWPPGFAGQVAWYIYNSAPRPVKEVAIVATLGLLAGICGKAFSITQSGLNMYIILIARSGVGKEALHSGVSKLMTAATSRDPVCMKFVNFTEFASGPALIKSVAENSCFVNVAGEWGRKLSRLAKDDGRDSAMHSLRTVMTDLYQKSGPQAIVGGLTYSSKAENIASISGVAYSMIGETTPGTFYECLTPSMMSDGFLSRFNVIEYNGERPPLNPNQLKDPDKALADGIAELCGHASNLINRNENVSVNRSTEAAEMIAIFELECDTNINNSEDESVRQMWNRAGLKSVKLAALLAVADNFMYPVIQEYHYKWALSVIRKDIQLMEVKMESGEVGVSDSTRERKILDIMKKYLLETPKPSYGVNPAMRVSSVITRKYLQMRIVNCAPFERYVYGSGRALDATLKSLCDSGYIAELPLAEVATAFKFHGKSYRILDVSGFK